MVQRATSDPITMDRVGVECSCPSNKQAVNQPQPLRFTAARPKRHMTVTFGFHPLCSHLGQAYMQHDYYGFTCQIRLARPLHSSMFSVLDTVQLLLLLLLLLQRLILLSSRSYPLSVSTSHSILEYRTPDRPAACGFCTRRSVLLEYLVMM